MQISLLGMFNALSPKDAGSKRVAADIAYGADPRQTFDVYAPVRRQGAVPVVFFIFGGSWSDGRKDRYAFVGRALAALGYLAILPNYRLVGAVEYPDFLRDCASAYSKALQVASTYGGDPARVALMGHSAGAYNAAMIALAPQYLATAGLLGTVRCLVGLSGPYDFYPFDSPITLRTFGAADDPRSTQPINLVHPNAPPMFLGTGDKDRLVYPRNTVALARRLREFGVPVVEKHYPALDHKGTVAALSRVFRHRAPVLPDVAEFLGAHLGWKPRFRP